MEGSGSRLAYHKRVVQSVSVPAELGGVEIHVSKLGHEDGNKLADSVGGWLGDRRAFAGWQRHRPLAVLTVRGVAWRRNEVGVLHSSGWVSNDIKHKRRTIVCSPYLETTIANLDQALWSTRQYVYAARILAVFGAWCSLPCYDGKPFRRVLVPDVLVRLVDAERGYASSG